uniref:Zinc finger Ran-binding domain-containing protein 2 n=1 Tax=Anopheles dirus TaxID=7168 RepID=A0A182NQ63_9DIPT
MSSAGYAKSDSDGKRPSNNKNGDWTCPEPENQCNRCGKERPNSGSKNGSTASDSDGGGSSSAGGKKKVGTEIGKAAAEKSRGLFSAEDWQCNKCANVNWARRHTCNICSAPRFCDVEERTGYGGGYNDRGVVEYKDRVESDDEYDEFGRRKKSKGKPKAQSSRLTQRRRGSDSDDEEVDQKNNKRKEQPRRKQIDEKPPVDSDEDDDEDEEDDEDNEDLSKYDLWGSEDEAAPKLTPQKSNSNHKQASHHHRSRSNTRSRSRSPDRRQRSNDQRSSKAPSSSTSHTRSGSKRSSASRRHGRSRSRSYSRSRSRSRSRSPRSYRRNKDRRR